MANLLLDWLHVGTPDQSTPTFTRINIGEGTHFDDAIRAKIASAILSSRVNDVLLQKLRDRLAAEGPRYASIAAEADPVLTTARRGDFGEILAALTMERAMGYQVPIKKLQHKARKAESPGGADVVCFKTDPKNERVIAELCYVESKLRTIREIRLGVEAHNQLADLYNNAIGEFNVFIGNALYSAGHHLADSFLDFLTDPADRRVTFCVALHTEAATRTEETINRLRDRPPSLTPLTVMIYRTTSLSERIDQCYAHVGMKVAPEDD
jgi:hypothetical protein